MENRLRLLVNSSSVTNAQGRDTKREPVRPTHVLPHSSDTWRRPTRFTACASALWQPVRLHCVPWSCVRPLRGCARCLVFHRHHAQTTLCWQRRCSTARCTSHTFFNLYMFMLCATTPCVRSQPQAPGFPGLFWRVYSVHPLPRVSLSSFYSTIQTCIAELDILFQQWKVLLISSNTAENPAFAKLSTGVVPRYCRCGPHFRG